MSARREAPRTPPALKYARAVERQRDAEDRLLRQLAAYEQNESPELLSALNEAAGAASEATRASTFAERDYFTAGQRERGSC